MEKTVVFYKTSQMFDEQKKNQKKHQRIVFPCHLKLAMKIE